MRKNSFKMFVGFFCILAIVQMIAAQATPPNESAYEKQRQEMEEQRIRQNVERSFDDLRKAGNNIPVGNRVLSDKNRARIILAFEEDALPGETQRLRPDRAYFDQFADFLKRKDTGLARLYPNMRCDQGKIVIVQEMERCADSLPIRGGDSFYSFRNRTNLNESGAWADIHFIDGRLSVGGRTEFGLIREIGDVGASDLSLKSAELYFLRKYKPENRVSDLTLEKQRLEKGLLDGFASSVPIKLNSTYIMRSVAYRREIFDLLDKRADMIVVFRIVAQETDGSLVLLWRELRSRDARKLKVN